MPLLLILFMKSKQLKAVGKASIVPVAFAVNEPLLFGAPMILNPYMLIPFVAAGCVNVSVAKFFIDNVGMNGFSFVVPWATPAPIGIFITTNFQLIALVFVAIIILLDAIIYLPFLKAYDKLLCDQEAERAAELLQLEQLAAELQARSEEMQAQLLRTPRIVGPRRMLRAYPKLRHGSKLRSLPTLREMLRRAEQENKDDNKNTK